MISPVKSGVLGFITGTSVPIIVAGLYLIPNHHHAEREQISWLKKAVELMNWQVRKLQSGQITSLSEGSYRDGLYWAGF